MIDDLYAYRLGDTRYLLIVNASRLEIDWMWIKAQRNSRYKSLQLEMSRPLRRAWRRWRCRGQRRPKSSPAFSPQPVELRKNQIAELEFGGATAWVSRTGYTGEDGFELVVPNERAAALWDQLMSLGQALGLRAGRLGRARHPPHRGRLLALRPRADVRHHADRGRAWLGRRTSTSQDFTGREMLAAQKQDGVSRRCIAFKMTGKSAPPRKQYKIFSADGTDREIGEVTSGTQSPSLGCGIGLGYVECAHAKPGTGIEIEIRNRRFPAQVVRRPIYRKSD